ASHDSLKPFVQIQNRVALHVPRSAEFLDWRILSHPHASEYFVLRPTGSDARLPECSAIARVMDLGDYKRLHFLALQRQSDNSRVLSSFFAGVVRWALSQSIDHIVFVTGDPAIARIAARWLPFKTKQRFAFHA